MTQIDIAALVADREAGTKGPWVASQSRWPEQIGCCPLIGRPVSIHNPATHLNVAAANNDADARRIARVPDMEDALIAQDAELKRLRAERGEIEAVIADLLTEILPWVEAQIDDPAYKPGTVRAVANRIRTALGEKP